MRDREGQLKEAPQGGNSAPGLRRAISDRVEAIQDLARKMIERHIPAVMAGYVRAHARAFTADELRRVSGVRADAG